MIQSPRGSINFPAQTSFDHQVTPRHINTPLTHTQNHTALHNNNIDSSNHLVWTNPIHSPLYPQITRQVVFSETLFHMAQSEKTPLGVNPFKESGATILIEWKQWFSTLKMAIMARDNIEVDKLLKLKPQPTDLFYPTLPTYEE